MVCVPTDICDPDQCRRLADAAAGLGRVDVLVNNVFTDAYRNTGSMVFDIERWRAPFEVGPVRHTPGLRNPLFPT